MSLTPHAAESPPAAQAAGEAATLPPSEKTAEALTALALAIPGYEIIQELGRGGMGVVYKAKQMGLDRLVAIKMILTGPHASAEQLARFRNEAKIIAQLHHPNIVQIHHVGEHEGRLFFALEFVECGSLAQALRNETWQPRRAAALVEKLARAMQAAHSRGIIHRDLKPANILLDSNGEPKITDFGLAKQLEETLAGQTASNAALGTPSYMAPEQTGGRSREIGPPSDVYALGAILYELLTGRPPFQADTPLDTILQVVSEEPIAPRQLCPDVPPDLETICLKCLSKKIEERYPDAATLADELQHFCEGEPISARPPSLWRRFARWRERRPGTTVALVFAVCVWLAGAVLTIGVFRNLLTMPVFAIVLFTFVRPTRRTFAVCAGVILLLSLLSYAIHDAISLVISLAQGLLLAVLVGTVGRLIAWAMGRDVVATTLGAFFGSVAGSLGCCCGLPFVLAFSFGMENVKKVQDFSKQAEANNIDEAQMLEFLKQFDYTLPLVLGIAWLLVCSLVPAAVGAIAGGAAQARSEGKELAKKAVQAKQRGTR